jgi:acetyl esterase/lipase
MEGLPPMLVQVGKSETMFGDALAYVDKARQAGVQVDFDPYDNVIHGWHNSAHVVPNMPEAVAAIAGIGKFFKSHSA